MFTGITVYLAGQATLSGILDPLFLSLPLSFAVLLLGYRSRLRSFA